MKKSNLLAGIAVLLAMVATWLSHVGFFVTGLVLFGIALFILIPVVYIWDIKEQKRKELKHGKR